MQTLKQQIIRSLQKVIPLLVKQVKILQTQVAFKKATDKNEVIYHATKSLLGENLRTSTTKALGCAEVINELFARITGKPIGGDVSTLRMYNVLRKEKRFREVKIEDRRRGDLIISATGFKEGWSSIENGHCGIIGEDDIIYSNDSRTGRLSDNWTLGKWLYYYKDTGKFFVKLYRIK